MSFFKKLFKKNRKKSKTVLPPMPSKDVLDVEFEKFLETISMPQQTIENMKKMTDEHKWLMICQNKMKKEIEPAKLWAERLKKSSNLETLLEFRPIVTTADVKWLQSFIDNNGLLNLVSTNLKNQKNEEVETACLRALKAFMNSDFGLKATIRCEEIFEYLKYPLLSENNETLHLLLDLFTVICWVSVKGHDIIYNLIKSNRKEAKLKTMYSPAVRILKNKKMHVEVMTSAITFLNAMVNSIPDLEERNHNRAFLIDEDIISIISNLRAECKSDDDYQSSLLFNQFDIFENEFQNDQKQNEILTLNLSEPEAVWNYLLKSSIETGQSAYLVDLLRFLLIIPNSRRLGEFIWKNCQQALKLSTSFVLNEKDIAEIESKLDKISDNSEIHAVIEKSFTPKSRLLKYDEIEKIMSKQYTKNAADKSEDQLETLRKEFHDFKMQKESEIDTLKRQIASGPPPSAAPAVAAPVADSAALAPPLLAPDGALAPPALAPDGALAPPPLGGDSLLAPPPLSGGLAPPPLAGGLAPPPMGGLGAPPPLGLAAAKPKAYLPDRPNKAPSVKMRNFHWGILPVNKIEGTVWDKIKDDSIRLNVTEFESAFQAKAAAAPKAVGKSSAKKVVKERVALVDSKRSTNVEIALSRFKMTPEAIHDAILGMDEKVLTPENISKLLNLVPTSEEAEMCASYEGNVADLGVTEKFFRVVSSINNISNRLNIFLFKLQFKENYEQIMNDINCVQKSANEIKNNENLKKILAIILKHGNHMNGGTKKGGIYGFKLNTLKQLSSTKSVDNKMTLLQYIVKYVHQNHIVAEKFVEQLSILEEVVKIESQNLQGQVNKMKNNINKINNMVKKTGNNPKDRFKSVMESFYNEAADKAAKMHTGMTNIIKDTEDIITLFGEDKAKMKWEEFFKIFLTFVESYQNGIVFWEKKKENEEKEKKRAKFALENKERMKKMKERKKDGDGNEKEAKADNVLKNLKEAHSDVLAQEILRRRNLAK